MSDQYRPGYLEAMRAQIPVSKPGDAGQLAATLVWLASDAAGYVTGQTIVVDGGVTIT
jgi:NAD(P)-dependent dehydrogenase (short-subunit alcohol dehydrogenase family)